MPLDVRRVKGLGLLRWSLSGSWVNELSLERAPLVGFAAALGLRARG